MRMCCRFSMYFLWILFLSVFGYHDAWAARLYEKSLALFQTKEQKANPEAYCFVVLGDSRGNDAMFRKALAKAASLDPLFVLHGGDFSNAGGEVETEKFLAAVRETAPFTPVFVVRGNHENSNVFKKRIGPFNFTLESRRLRLTLVALDNSDYKVKPEQQGYLRQAVAKASKDLSTAFAAMHVPPKTERWSWHTFSEGVEELGLTLKKYPVQGLFFSHVHLFDRAEFADIPAFITGGAGAPLVYLGFPGEAVYHVLLVRVKHGKASFEMVPLTD